MKKCPTCQKTFEDSMRFCQIDGTPLVEDAPELDPYKTIVARPIDISEPTPAAPEPPAPAMEATLPPIHEPDDLLEVPAADPLKTMYVSEDEMRQAMGSVQVPAEPVVEAPVAPEPPKFSEPEIPSPSFGDLSPAAPEPPAPAEAVPESIPSPFDSAPPVEPQADEAATIMQDFPPSSPFGSPEPSFAPVVEPVAPPVLEPVFKEPEPFNPVVGSPFQAENSPAAWTPPPAPDANWQNQEIGQNTPFQPPPVGSSSPSSMLGIVSLALGVIGALLLIPSLLIWVCGVGPFLLGIAAAITGFLARSRAKSQPEQYSGGGLAIVGIILGFLDIIAPFVIAIITFVLLGALGSFK